MVDLNDFNPAEVDRRFPNARRYFTGSVFICHAGVDLQQILDDIVEPVIYDRVADGYFLHSRRSGGSEQYELLVSAALRWCDKFIVVVSSSAIGHEWVFAELDWAARNRRSIIQCLIDDTTPSQVHPALSHGSQPPSIELVTIDFRTDVAAAQERLAAELDRLLADAPYPRFPNGRPGWR